MSRRLIPILVAAVVVIVILTKGEKPQQDDDDRNTVADVKVSNDDDDRQSRRDRRKSKKDSTQYALDVARSTWPPLEAGAAADAGDLQSLGTVNYYVVLDGSGSMLNKKCGGGSPKIEAAVDAVRHFFTAVPASANIGLAAFDKRDISERVPLGINNRDELRSALERIKAGSDTPLRTSMQIAYDKLTAQARKQLGYGEYHLVVVTDGEPDPDSEDPSPVVREILSQSPVVLHTIGFCIDSDHVLNQRNKTFYASATDPEELQKGLQAVLAESPAFDATKFN